MSFVLINSYGKSTELMEVGVTYGQLVLRNKKADLAIHDEQYFIWA